MMNFTQESTQDFYRAVENEKRRATLVAMNMRQGNDHCNNYDAIEADGLDYVAGSSQRHHSYVGHSDNTRDDDAGFAAIELLPASHSMDVTNAQFEDMPTIDDSAHPTSSSDGDIVDGSLLTLEDVLYQLQREIVSSVSHLESLNRYRQSSTLAENQRTFVWSEQAKNLFENAIEKLKDRHQIEMNGRYSPDEAGSFYETLNRVLLPLWPHGWMSSNELMHQVIRHITEANQVEDEFIEESDNMEELPMDEGRRKSDDFGCALYENVLGDNGPVPASVGQCTRNSGGEVSTEMTNSSSKPNYQLVVSSGSGGSLGSSVGAAMCFICDRSFQSAHLLKIHISHMHTPKALACPHCQSRHSTLNGLRFHLSTKHKGVSQRFLSDLIAAPPVTSVSVSSVGTVQQRGNNSATAYTPAVDDTRLAGGIDNSPGASANLTSVIRTNLPHSVFSGNSYHCVSSATTNGQSEIECSICKNKFATTGALKAHISMVHTEKCIKCRYCPKMYASQRAMLQHAYLKHHKERNCQCPRCGEKFQTHGLASLHRRYAHTCNPTMSSWIEPRLLLSGDLVKNNAGNTKDKASEPAPGGTFQSQPTVGRIRGNGKYHCRDCGAGFPMPSAVWAHRKKEHSDSTSIKKRGVFSVSDPRRRIGGQIFAHDLIRQSKDAKDNGKKKMRVKCSVCNAIFSNGYACYLHKKKIHGEESIRRELNLSDRSSTAKANPTGSLVTATTTSPKSLELVPPLSGPTTVSETAAAHNSVSGLVSQTRISSSSSSSRDSSPFYRPSDVFLAEGVVRRRYEFHCQCGMTFYNGFAYSRHRQRTGCSDGVRGIVVKESVCGVCSEAFPSPELLNEHFSSAHAPTTSSAHQTAPSAVAPKLGSSQQPAMTGNSFGTAVDDGASDSQLTSKEATNWEASSGESSAMTDYRRSPASSSQAVSTSQQQRFGATATAYVTTTTIKTPSATSPSTSNQVACRQETAGVGSGLVEQTNGVPSSVALERLPMRCLYCPYETLSVEALGEHARHHETINKRNASEAHLQSCPYCTYVTNSVCNYIRHASIHFVRKGSDDAAKRNENTQRPEAKKNQRLECVFCRRRFQTASELMEHEILHTAGK